MSRNGPYPCNIQLEGHREIQQKLAFKIYRFLHTSLCHGLSSRIIVCPGWSQNVTVVVLLVLSFQSLFLELLESLLTLHPQRKRD
jgi:hypothetical protein